MKHYIKRGDIYNVELGSGIGSEQNGFRPGVIIQNDMGNRHSPTVIIGEILGHTLKGVSTALGISPNMPDVTARYVEVRAPRKSIVLEAYHNAVFPREAERLAAKKSKGRDAVR